MSCLILLWIPSINRSCLRSIVDGSRGWSICIAIGPCSAIRDCSSNISRDTSDRFIINKSFQLNNNLNICWSLQFVIGCVGYPFLYNPHWRPFECNRPIIQLSMTSNECRIADNNNSELPELWLSHHQWYPPFHSLRESNDFL